MLTIREAEEILKKEYHIDNFTYVVKDILLPDFVSDKHEVHFKNNIFNKVTLLGISQKCELSVYEVILNEGTQNRRVTITQEMFRILRGQGINNALVAFSNADRQNYRLSLLTSKYEFDGDKVVKVLSNPRRYSYALGFGTKTKTAYQFLVGKGKVNSLDELIDRFSVEVVNKQFYNEIALSFTKLVGGEREGKHYEKELNLYSVTSHNKYAEFAVRLIGRIIFCWFLKEKKSENGISLVPDSILSLDGIRNSTNYYHDVLEPLFFELLNTNQRRRKGKFATEEIYNQIPYLNGGLFSPHHDDQYKFSPATQTGQYGQVTIPNEWFEDFYKVLNEYNFTVDENTAYDIELSIDPEMLGRIFENLLAEINPETGENAKKSTGSFYTPRDIVDYMVDNSILEYLKTKTEIDEVKLKALISYSKDDDHLAVFDNQEKKKIINALYTITILDPACGSGAFPIGMLQKIVYILQEVDPEANLWFDKATENVSILLKKEFEKKFNAGSLNYIRKLSVIQNSIFGVDIQPIAVEIARLRCFLSLVIEETVYDDEDNRGINPLPSLDFKFIIANSLIKLDEGKQLSMFENQSHIDELKAVRDEYFNADSERKAELREEFADIQKRMLQATIDQFTKQPSKRYEVLYRWAPFKNEPTDWFDPEWMFGVTDGFDIVIGNPPYGIVYDVKLKSVYEETYSCFKRNNDTYVAFYQKAIELLNTQGFLAFITPNTFLNGEYFKALRKHIKALTKIVQIVDYKEKAVFCDPTVFVAISLLAKQLVFQEYRFQMKIAKNDGFKEIDIDVDEISDLSIKLEDPILNKIRKGCKGTVDSYFAVKDVGFNYWSEGKGKLRDGNSIGSRILYCGPKENPTDMGYIKGRDFYRYSLAKVKNYLRCNYQKFLNANDTFRFSPDILSISPKIIYRQTANCIIATMDAQGLLVDKTVHVIVPKGFDYNIFLLLGLLNSKLFQYLYSNLSQETKGRAFSQVKTVYIKQLPLKEISQKDTEDIIGLVKEALLFASMGKSTVDVEMKIDRIVYKAYELDEKEIGIIEKQE